MWRRERVPPRRINEIVHGKRGISADAALRSAKHVGTSAQFWRCLKSQFDLNVAEDRAAEGINAIPPLRVAWPSL